MVFSGVLWSIVGVVYSEVLSTRGAVVCMGYYGLYWGAKVYSGCRSTVGAVWLFSNHRPWMSRDGRLGEGLDSRGGSVGELPTGFAQGADSEMELSRQDMHWGDRGTRDPGGKGVATHGITGAPASPAMHGGAGGPFRTDGLSPRVGPYTCVLTHMHTQTHTCTHRHAHAQLWP